MQNRTINGIEVSRFGWDTKHVPVHEADHAVRINRDEAHEMVDTLVQNGGNLINTSYSFRKGEAEAVIGDEIAARPQDIRVATSFFELVDPRFDYVFQKQQQKLQKQCIDFYFVEGVADITHRRDIDSGAVDYLFGRKEAGEIGALGVAVEMKAENLKPYLEQYPWDFVRLRVNYFDWYMKGLREQYEVITSMGIPIVAHGTLRNGPRNNLKPEALAILKEANPERTAIDWNLRFVKSLENVAAVTVNAENNRQLTEDLGVFGDDAVLNADEIALLESVAEAQKARPGKK